MTSFDDITPVVTRLPHLRVLHVDGCDFQQSLDFLDDPISSPVPPLEEFHFSGTGLIPFDFLRFLYRCAPTLRKLVLRNKNFDFLDRQGRQIDPAFIFGPCFNLRELDLFGVHLPVSFPAKIKSHMANLVHLDLANCELPELALLDLFSEPLPQLKSLTLSQPANFELITQIGRSVPQLEHFELQINRDNVLTEEQLVSLSQLLPNLVTVRLWALASVSLDPCELALSTWTRLTSILLGVRKPEGLNLDDVEFVELLLHYPTVEIRCFCPGRLESSLIAVFNSHVGTVPVNRIEVHLEVENLGEGDVYFNLFTPSRPINFDLTCVHSFIQAARTVLSLS